MVDIVRAPWTDEQVAYLNNYQAKGFFHPFTCGPCRDAEIDSPLYDEHILVATTAGWICPTCDYVQDWAHAGMMLTPA